MPGPNLDLIRRVYDEFNQTRELSRWALADDVAWYPPADEPDNAPRHGADRVVAYIRDWSRAFAEYHVEVHELTEHDDEHIVAALTQCGRLTDDSAELRLPLTQVWTLRGGTVTCIREYRTTASAVEAIQTAS